MSSADVFAPRLRSEELWFTFILGLACGIVVCGLAMATVRPALRRTGASVAVTGLAAGLFVCLTVLDRSPIEFVDFRLKPYIAELAEGAALLAAGLAGTVATAAGIFLVARMGSSRRVAAATGCGLLAVAGGVLAFDRYTGRQAPGQPPGTDLTHQVAATRVIEGLEMPTGLAVAPNGDVAVVELEAARFSLFRPTDGGFKRQMAVDLPVPSGGIGLHVAFHPDYPSEPNVYVTASGESTGRPTMVLLSGLVMDHHIEWSTLVEGLAMAARDDGGDHFGGAIAICSTSLFVSTGDTEPGPAHHLRPGEPGTIRQDALQLSSPLGKVFRWTLNGTGLQPSGIAEGTFPVFAVGFRNPFGMACNPLDATPIVAENGPAGHDQIRPVPPGSNHEWPFSVKRDLFVQPYFDSGPARLAPTGVATRTAGDGFEVLFSTFNARAIYGFDLDAHGPGRVRLLHNVEGGALNIAARADGCVLFADTEAIWQLDDGRCK